MIAIIRCGGAAILAATIAISCAGHVRAKTPPAVSQVEGSRQVIDLSKGWRFQFGETGEAPAQPGFDDSGWTAVSVPHTWNRVGSYGDVRAKDTDNRQGFGWYRLTFRAPLLNGGKRAYLDFGAVSKVADVWVNGVHMGQHRGAFARFRYDVTGVLKPGQPNLVVVRADNAKPVAGSATGETIPLAGDFFVFGGIYRPASLVISGQVGIDLLDYGGPGVYAHASAVSADRADVKVLVRLRDFAGARHVALTTTIRDATGKAVAHTTRSVVLPTGASEAQQQLTVTKPHLWNGTADPYLYSLTAQVFDHGRLVDRVTQPLGLRTVHIDPNDGFVLNGRSLKLHGVSRHQDRPGEGWALTPADAAQDMALIREIGANTIRMAHYQHAEEWVDQADKAGMAVWAEVPYVTTPSLVGGQGSPELWANAEQQLKEMIRQQQNHPSIVLWSVGNEVDAARGFGIGGKEPATPLALLKHLNAVAHAEDPSRATTFADCCEELGMVKTAGEALAGTADVIGYNRYYGWYYPQPLNAGADLAAQMDHFHTKHPALPISISEYGGGGAITQHSDNIATGYLNFTGRPQPEEFESFVHEQNWPTIAARKFIFASWVWNMFDFASDLREEGDSFDLNTKGLVTYDRKVKKDAFYYYRAQWSDQPVLWLTGKRYVDRAYPVMDVKAYSNADKATLRVNGVALGEVACPGGICVWPRIALAPGANRATVTASIAGKPVSDETVWNGPDPAQGIRLDAGALAGRVLSRPDGATRRFGSDNFVHGGTAMALNLGGFGGRRPTTRKVDAPDPALYEFWREGEAFGYAIPVPNGAWTVTIHTFDAHPAAPPALLRATANGQVAINALDVRQAAGGGFKGLSRSFPVTVSDGVLRLDFAGTGGKAAIAAIEITK